MKIDNLKNEILSSQYDNTAILAEVKILFPEIENISISNHTFNTNKKNKKIVPVLLYLSKKNLSKTSEQKLVLWLQQRLSKEKIEIYRKE